MSKIKYAYLKEHTWLYRRNYPKDVALVLGTAALKQSLKTGDVKTARTRAAEVNARFEGLVQTARSGAGLRGGPGFRCANQPKEAASERHYRACWFEDRKRCPPRAGRTEILSELSRKHPAPLRHQAHSAKYPMCPMMPPRTRDSSKYGVRKRMSCAMTLKLSKQQANRAAPAFDSKSRSR